MSIENSFSDSIPDNDMLQALDRTRVENFVLNRIIEVVCSGAEVDDVLLATTELIPEATSADACFVHLLDEGRRHLILRAATNPYRDMIGKVQLNLGEGVAGWVAQHRQPVIIAEDKWSDPRYKYIPELGGDHYTSLISVPLISPAGRLKGSVNVHTKEHRAFSSKEVTFLQHVGSLISGAIEHAELLGELNSKEQALQGIVERTVQAQEEERRRVAAEIHDGVTQYLISIWYRLNACERLLERDPVGAGTELEAAKELVGHALTEARAAIYDLRPSMLDDLGLGPALEALAAHVLGDDFDVTIMARLGRAIPNHLEAALYRIAQEALNNIRKHAGRCRVEVVLDRESDDQLVMRVADDGRGFDVDSYRVGRAGASFGLAGITERASLIRGRLRIESAAGAGTQIEVRVPLDSDMSGG